jgi:epoxyqueuosine reductase QueG
MDLNRKISALVKTWGGDFFGVANLLAVHDVLLEQYGPVIAGYPRSVSVGIALLDSLVDSLPRRAERVVAINYKHHAYDVINQRLDLITSQIAGELQRAGWQALPVSASKCEDEARLRASFSHKLAARLAGLGWIGKNALLITPEAGPRVRWATVLTDAPLAATGQSMKEHCGGCKKCVEICPVHAFTGEPYQDGQSRERQFDAHKCNRNFAELGKNDPALAVCGLCLYVCPHGRRRKHKAETDAVPSGRGST